MGPENFTLHCTKGAWPIIFVLRRVGGHFGCLIEILRNMFMVPYLYTTVLQYTPRNPYQPSYCDMCFLHCKPHKFITKYVIINGVTKVILILTITM